MRVDEEEGREHLNTFQSHWGRTVRTGNKGLRLYPPLFCLGCNIVDTTFDDHLIPCLLPLPNFLRLRQTKISLSQIQCPYWLASHQQGYYNIIRIKLLCSVGTTLTSSHYGSSRRTKKKSHLQGRNEGNCISSHPTSVRRWESPCPLPLADVYKNLPPRPHQSCLCSPSSLALPSWVCNFAFIKCTVLC